MPPVEERLDRLARDASQAVRGVAGGVEEKAPAVGRLRVRLRRRRQVRVVAGTVAVVAVASGVLVGVAQEGSLRVPVIGQDEETLPDEAVTPAEEEIRECPSSEPDRVDVEVDGWEQLASPPAPRARGVRRCSS